MSGYVIEVDDRMIREIDSVIKREAEKRRLSAGYQGAMHDGGARSLLAEWDIWKAGWNRKLHSSFATFALEIARGRDPEYGEYRRLQQKFEKGDE